MKFTLMHGYPGSGKTTWATETAEREGAFALCLDDYIANRLTDQRQIARVGFRIGLDQLLDAALEDAKRHLGNGEDVIFDTLSTTKEFRKKVLDSLRDVDCKTECVWMNTPKSVCAERKPYAYPFPYKDRFETPTEDEGFDNITVITYGGEV